MRFYDRVRVVCATIGQGTITLGAAVSSNFFTLAEAGAADGELVAFVIEEGGSVEISSGIVGGSGTTLTRTVYKSKISGVAGTTKLELAGDAVVYIVQPSAWLNTVDLSTGQFEITTASTKTADYPIVVADAGNVVVMNSAISRTSSLPDVTGDGREVYLVRNIGSADYVIDPNSTQLIEGASTRSYKQGEGGVIYKNADKTGWLTFDFGKGALKENNGSDFPNPATVASNLSLVRYVSQTLDNTQKNQVYANLGLDFLVGLVFDFPGSSLPSGFLWPNGQNVSRTVYALLFAKYSTTYGAGDGSTTFGLPDLRGRVIAGKDDMGGSSANRLTGQSGGLNGDNLGAAGGSETHSLSVTEMPSHDHSYVVGASALAGTGAAGRLSGTATGDTTGNTGGSGAHNNVQPTFILNKIIFSGVF